ARRRPGGLRREGIGRRDGLPGEKAFAPALLLRRARLQHRIPPPVSRAGTHPGRAVAGREREYRRGRLDPFGRSSPDDPGRTDRRRQGHHRDPGRPSMGHSMTKYPPSWNLPARGGAGKAVELGLHLHGGNCPGRPNGGTRGGIRMKVHKLFHPVATLIVCLALAATPAAAQGFGARAYGMGGAYTAVADDVASLLYNPAGLVMSPATL